VRRDVVDRDRNLDLAQLSALLAQRLEPELMRASASPAAVGVPVMDGSLVRSFHHCGLSSPTSSSEGTGSLARMAISRAAFSPDTLLLIEMGSHRIYQVTVGGTW
jgi:hypothetical protein